MSDALHGRHTLTVDELIARAEITDVIKDLARGTDRLDRDLMAGCYHPDGFDDHNAFRGSGTEFAQWVCDVLPHFEATMHFVGPPRIRIDAEGPTGPDVAFVDTYCEAHHVSRPDEQGNQTDMVLGLRYVDRFERRPAGPDGTWLIAKRVCAFDWSSTVTTDAAARYRFDADFTVGHRDRTDITYLMRREDPS